MDIDIKNMKRTLKEKLTHIDLKIAEFAPNFKEISDNMRKLQERREKITQMIKNAEQHEEI
jgi:hypothetical protein